MELSEYISGCGCVRGNGTDTSIVDHFYTKVVIQVGSQCTLP